MASFHTASLPIERAGPRLYVPFRRRADVWGLAPRFLALAAALDPWGEPGLLVADAETDADLAALAAAGSLLGARASRSLDERLLTAAFVTLLLAIAGYLAAVNLPQLS